MPFIIRQTPPCDQCGSRFSSLFPAFLNDRGFVNLCGQCVEPVTGPPRAYTGPNPIRVAKPALRLIAGGAGR